MTTRNLNYSWILLIMVVISSASNVAEEIKPFTTDGCSSFPDGTMKQQTLWLNCCIKHDLAYWQGGTYDERLEADKALERCVANVGEGNLSKVMMAGVRVGGSPYFPTSFRWGYGWSFPRGYQALTVEEKQEVKKKLNQLAILLTQLASEIDRHSDDRLNETDKSVNDTLDKNK